MFREHRTRMRRAALVAALLLMVLVAPVVAQTYYFNLEENRVELFINSDGSVEIVYDMTFVNDSGADPIDVIDVGMPNSTYRLSETTASVDGIPLTRISDSPYVTPGIAIELGSHAIPPGQRGTVHFETMVHDLIYQDSDDDAYASLEFSPTWFDSEFVFGATRVDVTFHFPPGVTSEEPRYHKNEFTDAGFSDDRVYYTWIDENASGSKQYVFGASFPQEYLDEGVVQKAPAFTFNPGAICSSPFTWFLVVGGGWAGIAILGSRSKKRRKLKYLPPALSVEGSGIKRGLTAVEAAILLEAPLNKVMTMILFGLIKKGVLTVESEKPMKVRAADPLPKDVKVWYYERRLLKAIKPDGTLAEDAMRDLVIDLIGDVNKKVTGFSRKETKSYYNDVAARAWKQVEAAGTPEALGEQWSKGLEWTMLEDDWDDRTRRVFQDRPVVLPHWWGYHRPWSTTTSVPSQPATSIPRPAGTGTPVTLPTLPGADFANTVVGGIENAANTVVSGIDKFTGNVTKTTNPPPKTSSSSRSGGGYSCACACACAGCACACAGGGR